MRFQRQQRYAFVPTSRKAAAVLRSQRREREKYPLFAEAIAAEQKPVDEVFALRATRWAAAEIEERATRAADWRRARAALRAIEPHETRGALARFWNFHRWFPATPGYLLSMLHMWRTDRLDMTTPGMQLQRRAKPSDRFS